VVQQAQGRVKPTMQWAGGVAVNDNRGLEKEADVMGARALGVKQMRQDGDGGLFNRSPLWQVSSPSLQLQAVGPVYQFNGKEKAAIAGLAFVGGVLLTWLWGKWDEKTALQKQQAIIEDFESRMKASDFRTHKEDRENMFVLAALKEGVSEDVARSLFKESGAAAKDTVTGFDLAADRKPTIQNAIDGVNKIDTATAFYVEVDIRNLGGLNSALGHTGADGVFATLAQLTGASVKQLESAGVKVGQFRHGGDEFSFVVFSNDGRVRKSTVEHQLEIAHEHIGKYVARTTIASINSEWEDKDATLRSIVHPKHKGEERFYGTGIIFGVSRILGTDDVGKVTSAADREVEIKKNA
jgi:GGDEF domain-containing protein